MKIKSYEENNSVSLDLRLGLDPWVIKKMIEASGIENLSSLLLTAEIKGRRKEREERQFYIILLYNLYYFNVLYVKIKVEMLGIL